jgi:hypothetical protein
VVAGGGNYIEVEADTVRYKVLVNNNARRVQTFYPPYIVLATINAVIHRSRARHHDRPGIDKNC